MISKENRLDSELYEQPFTVIGFIDSDAGYKVASKFHKQLSLDFLHLKDFVSDKERKDKKTKQIIKEKFNFMWFFYYDKVQKISYCLLSNKNKDPINISKFKDRTEILLVEEFKDIDYILLVIGRDCIEKSKEVKNNMTKMGIMFLKIFGSYDKQDNDLSQDIMSLDFKVVSRKAVEGKKSKKGRKSNIIKKESMLDQIHIDIESNMSELPNIEDEFE